MTTMIEVENLGKHYRRGGQDRVYRTFREDLLGLITRPFRRRRNKADSADTFWALRDVSFQVNEGEVVGIIGKNGAGKSTLLKILSRITQPTEGRARLYGRVSSLLEVGTGFHPELTGRENIYLSGTILGMRRAEVRSRFDEIVAFSEIGDFLDTPVKHYSSGMYVRLGFAIAAHFRPDILLIDEVLAVGDTGFRMKCYQHISNLKASGVAIILISHIMVDMQRVADRVIVLDSGSKAFDGSTTEGVYTYESRLMATRSVRMDAGDNKERERTAWIESVTLSDEQGRKSEVFRTNDSMQLEITLRCEKEIPKARLICAVDSMLGPLGSMATPYSNFWPALNPPQTTIRLTIRDLPLLPGAYSFHLHLYGEQIEDWFDSLRSTAAFRVVGSSTNPFGFGLAHLVSFAHSWEIVPGTTSANPEYSERKGNVRLRNGSQE